MGAAGNFWTKICEPLDGFLWHRDITHPIIRPLLRNQILAGSACILLGGLVYIIFPWLFWFGCGIICMGWIFWSWARFFIPVKPDEYNTVFLKAFFLNFGLRFIILAILLYFALTVFQAVVSALLAGLVCGAVLALWSYIKYMRVNPGA